MLVKTCHFPHYLTIPSKKQSTECFRWIPSLCKTGIFRHMSYKHDKNEFYILVTYGETNGQECLTSVTEKAILSIAPSIE